MTSKTFAGIERQALNLIRQQSTQGWRAELACPRGAHRLRAAALAAGIPVLPASSGRPRAWLFALTRAVLDDRPEVLHVHDGRSALVGRVLAIGAGGLFVRTQHFVHTASMDRSRSARKASLAIHRCVNRRLDAFIAVSQSVASASRDRCETGDALVVVIPPAVELPTDAALRRARDVRSRASRPVVVFAGRLEAERHLDILLRAVPLVRAEIVDCHFVLAGSGAAEEDLRRLAAELGVEDAVTWPGWVADTYEVLAHAHLYVNTWPREAFGMTMAEAMALALPVIAVDAGANTEMVDDGVTGYLVPADDPQALAAAVIAQLKDLTIAAGAGEAARRRAVADFGSRTTARSTLDLYERLLQRTPR